VLLVWGWAAEAEDLRALVSQGNRGALEAVQTYSARVECSIRDPSGKIIAVNRGEYWRSQDGVRVREVEGDSVVDTLVGQDVTRTLVTVRTPNGERRYRGGIDVRRHGLDTVVDAWYAGLCKVSADYLPLSELLDQPWDQSSVKELHQEGRQLYRIDLVRGTCRLEIYADPGVNYLVRKVVSSDTDSRVESEVLRFREVDPALYLPELIEHRFVERGAATHTVSCCLQDILVNQALPLELFGLRFPPGTFVADSVRGLSYSVGENEQPVGTPIKMEQGILPAPEETRTATIEEPTSSLRWWVIGVLTPPTFLGAFLAIRRRTRTR
jgi:hypothetical protein